MKTDHLAAVRAAPGRFEEYRRFHCPVSRAQDDDGRARWIATYAASEPRAPATRPRRPFDAAGENASSVHLRVRSKAPRKAPVLL